MCTLIHCHYSILVPVHKAIGDISFCHPGRKVTLIRARVTVENDTTFSGLKNGNPTAIPQMHFSGHADLGDRTYLMRSVKVQGFRYTP